MKSTKQKPIIVEAASGIWDRPYEWFDFKRYTTTKQAEKAMVKLAKLYRFSNWKFRIKPEVSNGPSK